MDTAGLTMRPRARDDVLFRQLDDQWVIFDPITDKLHALNLTAALIWSECTGERNLGAIAAEVATSFDPPMSRDDVLADVVTTIGRFREQGLLLERH